MGHQLLHQSCWPVRLGGLTGWSGSSSLLDMTLNNEDHISALRAAAERVEQTKAEFDRAKADRETLIAQVALAGGTYREIAAESGLSFQRVHQLLTGEKPPMRPFGTDLLFHCPTCDAKPGERCKDEKGKRRIHMHIERSWRCQAVFEEGEDPQPDEPGPHTPLYQPHERIGVGFHESGPVFIDPDNAAAYARTLNEGYVGRWTGTRWERIG